MFFMKFNNSKRADNRAFMDHASATPADPSVLAVMERTARECWQNPSSLHAEGVAARKILDDARARVAKVVRCRAAEIYFTGSGTEADNIAVLGVLKAVAKESGAVHLVTTSVEHPAVARIADAIENGSINQSVAVTHLAPREDGRIDLEALRALLRPDTALVSVIHAHNEFGTVIDTRAIRRVLDEYKKSLGRDASAMPYLHADASQSPAHLSVDRQRLGVDLLTLDGSKIYGPKGVGALYVRHGVPIESVTYGGSQERGLRPGTENVPAIAGFATALELCEAKRESEVARLTPLRDSLIEGVLALCERIGKPASVNGDAEMLVLRLDAAGISCSAAASCNSLADDDRSEAIVGLGKPSCAGSSLRFTLGRSTNKAHIERALKALEEALRF
jgi:cysteine desulfurase